MRCLYCARTLNLQIISRRDLGGFCYIHCGDCLNNSPVFPDPDSAKRFYEEMEHLKEEVSK